MLSRGDVLVKSREGRPEGAASAHEPDTRRLRRYHILRRKREFDRVFSEGRTFRFPEMVVRAAPNGLPWSRLGLMVGRRHGSAVRRNRMKRLLREAFRLNRGLLRIPCDVVLVPNSGWQTLTLSAIEPVVRRAFEGIRKALGDG